MKGIRPVRKPATFITRGTSLEDSAVTPEEKADETETQ